MLFLRRAAPLGAALFILAAALSSFAVDLKPRKAETSKDIIEKAYNLSLQKDRSQAVNILVAICVLKVFMGASSAPSLASWDRET
ncbi:MAG: hypothetical protein EOP06_24895, partial [Proteobacteria bacterium]